MDPRRPLRAVRRPLSRLQAQTDFGGYIDLLRVKRKGDLVVAEMKRYKTPGHRASLGLRLMGQGLSREQVTHLADKHLLPAKKEEWSYSEGAGEYYSWYAGCFSDEEVVERFLAVPRHVTRR